MNATSNESVASPVATNGKPGNLAPVVPDYASFGKDQIRDVSVAVVSPIMAFLRGLDFRTLAMVLSTVGLVISAGILAWPTADASGYRVLGACVVSLMIAAIGLAAVLTDKGNPSATSSKDRTDPPLDPGPC